MDNLQDRQDVPIWKAVDAKNYKQALKLVDKRLSKKPTDYLEAVKIYIQAHMPQIADKIAVIVHLSELSKRKVAITDLPTIELCEDALDEVSLRTRESWQTWVDTIGEMRWQCVKATPKNEDTSLRCLEACLGRDDLDHARQIANSLEKSFPKNRSYIFWNILTMFLFATSSQCPGNQKRIWGGLANGQMSKLAVATQQVTDMKQLPIRSLHTPQELLLLDRITEAFGKAGQRLDYLQDPKLGPESVVAKGDWGLWILRVKLMCEEGHWEELFKLCGALLERARTSNDQDQLTEASFSDWMIWETYLNSARHLEEVRLYEQIRNEVDAHLLPTCKLDKSWKRNACLAQVRLAFDDRDTPATNENATNVDTTGQTARLWAVTQYLKKYGSANTAYTDLRQFVEVLHSDERMTLLTSLDNDLCSLISQGSVDTSVSEEEKSFDDTVQIAQAINNLKLKYLLVCSIPENERRQRLTSQSEFICTICSSNCGIFCSSCLLHVSQQSISLYGKATKDDGNITKSLLPTDSHPADDFCLLAATCLIKIALMSQDEGSDPLKRFKTKYLLQASALLESAWTRSKSDFQLSLLLVRLYTYLGCGSLAMRAYERLSLKQVQLDTLSYIMFDRISSLHPHHFNEVITQQIKKQQKLYASSKGHISRNIWLSYKHGSYNSIFEFNEVSHKLAHSLSAVMCVVASNKIQRFAKGTVESEAIRRMYSLIPAEIESPESVLSDNNDYETYPNYESSRAPGFEELSRFMPGPTEYRYRQDLLAEKVKLIVDPTPDLGGERSILEKTLKAYLLSQQQYWTSSKAHAKSLTRPEQTAGHAYQLMALIIAESCDQEFWLEGDFETRLASHNQDLCSRLSDQTDYLERIEALLPAFQDTLHAIHTAHELARTALQFCKYLAGKRKEVHRDQGDASRKIEKEARRLMEVVMAKCTLVKKGMDEGGWIDKVLESVLPEKLPEKLSGSEESFVEGLREVLDEVFMEQLAGEVVESWKESAVGFSYIKMPAGA